MTLRTRWRQKIGSGHTLGPKGFDCDIVFNRGQTLDCDTRKDIVANRDLITYVEILYTILVNSE